ncbi:MAG TPA: phage tail protein, partial [Sphaerochaeta sp.]|nr:phage tail protein [Sphaerochaeta sp.]
MNKEEELLIEGAGKKSKPKTQAPPVEAPNTLRSRAKGRILDLIAYGPIKGPVNGLKSVFLDDTPVENADGTLNFQGIDLDFVHGDPDQDVIPGFVDVSNPREINTEVKFDTPITRSLLNNDADAVLVTVRVPALVSTDVKTGNTNPASLPLTIQVMDGSNNIVAATSDTIQGKNTSPYERSYRLNIKGTGPFTVKVSRGDKESDKQTLQNDLYWSYLTEIIDIRHSYPNCAMFGISVDAELFGSSIPTRKYLLDLSIIKVPSNYNPKTRAYTGFWDGTFKEAWSDNPAWCYYDLATHPVIGAGIEEVNKWALYEIGRYCDELVPDGYGGMEPRFTCNTIFSQSEEAITALNTLASVFRGMTYWGSDTVEPVADMPGPIRKIITPSDVIDGDFVYQGTSLKERHSVAVVMWNDPADQYEAKPEMVEDPESIELLGWRDIQVTAVACTSRGQARRLGLWLLYSERAETQTVSFTVTAKHADFRPGDFFHLQDPYRAGARLGGKVIKVEGKAFTLDEVPAEVTVGWLLTLETEEGGLEQVTVASVRDNVVNVRTSPTQPVIAGASFALSSAQVNPQTFRVASVMEQEGSVYGITATAHDPRKYQAVEQGLKLPDLPTSFLPTGRLSAPTNLSARTYKFQAGGTENQGLTMGWTAPDDARVSEFMLDVKGPDDVAFGTRYVGKAVSFDIDLVTAGKWFFRVRSVSQEWGNSAWAESSIEITNLLMPKAPTGLVFNVTSSSVTILPQYLGTQDFEFWRSSVALTEGQVLTNATYIGTGSFFSDINLKFDTEYFYYVRGVNLYGQSAWVAGQAKTSADVDEILEVILKETQETSLGKWFQKEITKISAPADIVGSVNNRVEAAVGDVKVQIDSSIADIQQTIRDVDLKIDTSIDAIETDVNTKNTEMQNQLTILQGELSAFVNADVWDRDLAYVKNDVVQWYGFLYVAKDAIAVGTEPFQASTEWEKIGDFVSLTGAIGDLALRAQRSEAKVEIIDGIVTPMVSDLNSMAARWREIDEDEDSYLDAAIDAWEARADFSEEVKVRASQFEALSQRLTVFSTSLGDLGSSITTLEQSLTTEIESVAQSVTSLEGKVGEDIEAAILVERGVRVSAEQAIAGTVEALEVRMGEDINSAISSERTVRVSAEQALGQRIDTVVSSTEDNSSAIQSALKTLTDADSALGQRIDTVTASTVTADGKAVAAKAAADAAQGTANTAKTDAATAAGIANSKGKTIIQPTAPAAADRLPQNLWIDTTGGANTPKKWETNKWVAVTDKVAVDAANAAAVADGKAVAAKAAADAAAAVGTTNTAAIQDEKTARTNADEAIASQLNSVVAWTRERDEDEDGELENAIDAWTSRAAVQEEIKVRTTETTALASRTTLLTAEVKDVKASVVRVESVISTEIEAISESITQLRAQINEDIGAALTEE